MLMSIRKVMGLLILGVDAPQGWALLDVPPIGQATLIALGCLDRGREPEELAEYVRKYQPVRVCVERPREVYIGGRGDTDNKGQRRATTSSLIQTADLAGELVGVAGMLIGRANVGRVDAAQVRRELGGRPMNDDGVKALVAILVKNWPARSNTHERDAAMAAIWAARHL